ncbi:ribosomal-processing cysteine protease Prp [Levilactobacillus bambusae]|nr:ribosomal-processing cysteine protease Prp [Levilactobacillus bambusae]
MNRRDTVIHVKMDRTETQARISIYGHAMQAPYGNDIVCAGISTLFTGVANYLSHATADLHPNESIVTAVDLDAGDERLLSMFRETVAEIAMAYPNNVELWTWSDGDGRQE